MTEEKKELTLEELGEYVVDTAYGILQNLFKNKEEIKQNFETDDPDWEKALDRFVEFFKKDEKAALTGIIISSLVTSDLFVEILSENADEEHEHNHGDID